MNRQDLTKGIGLGILAGAVAGALIMPKKKSSMKRAAGKAMKTVGQVMESLSDDMMF